MAEFRGYDSLDDMFADIKANQDAASAKMHPSQQAIGYGDHWVRFYNIKDRLIIFGYIPTKAENWTACLKAGGDMDEAVYEARATAASMENNMLFGWAYSIIEPAGELGATHRYSMWPCPVALFESAKAVGWNIDLLDLPGQAMLQALWSRYRAWVIEAEGLST
jgi:hypothetical protein